MDNLNQIKNKLIQVCHKIYDKGFVTATDGNVSIKISENKILCTRSNVCKGDISITDLIITDLDGNKLSGFGNPTSELKMHLECYKVRKDINSVVHAHPPIAVSLTIAGLNLEEYVLPEVIVTLGKIPTVPYKTTGTIELALSLKKYIKDHSAVMLDKHGSVTVGKNIDDAYYKLEKLEHFAYVYYLSKQLGNIIPPNKDQIKDLLVLKKKLGY